MTRRTTTFDRAERCGDPGPAGDAMKVNEGGLTTKDLLWLAHRLVVLARYCPADKPCRSIVLQCAEIAYYMHSDWMQSEARRRGR